MSSSHIVRLEGYIQSIYLVVYTDKILLLDGCCRPDVPMVLNYIHTTLQRPISDLKVVVVTHMHPDHAGGAAKFKAETGCLIVSAQKKKQWYGGVGGQLMHLIDIGLAHYVAKRQGHLPKYLWYSAHLQPDIGVNDGDRIPAFDEWQVVETPGHTDRDLSILHVPSGQIYVADLIIKLKHKFVAPFPLYSPTIYADSLRKVRDLKPSKVMMAHGGEYDMNAEIFNTFIEQAPKHRRTIKDTIKHKLFWQKKFGINMFAPKQ